MRVKWNDESRRKLEVRAERPLGMVAPQIRDLDSGSAIGIEISPFEIAGRHENGLAWPCFQIFVGLRLSGRLRQNWRRQDKRDRKGQNVRRSHRVLLCRYK